MDENLLGQALQIIPTLARACRALEAAVSGRVRDVETALSVLREAALAATDAIGALEIWTERARLRGESSGS